MARFFDKSPPGRMNFRKIAREVRKRSGNRSRPTDIQIVNAIGMNAARPHSLVPERFEYLAWDAANSISTEDAERWMTEHLVPYFAALQAEWNDRKAERRNRKGWQESRLAYMRKIGYGAFKAEFDALHEERRTRKDVDGWLLKKYRDRAAEILPAAPKVKPPEPPPPTPSPQPMPHLSTDINPLRAVRGTWRRGWCFWKMKIEAGVPWIAKVTMKGDTEIRCRGEGGSHP